MSVMVDHPAGSRVIAALIALVLAMLVLAPAVDAVACAPDGGVAFTESSVDERGTPGDHDDGPIGLDACTHGHCHHTAAAIVGSLSDAAATPTDGIAFVAPSQALPPLSTLDGLKRPPRG